MAVVTAHIIQQCVCGSTVAYVESSRGKLYPVDINGTVTQDKLGRDTAVVKNNDFHHCAYYPGLADFLLRAIERSKAKRLRIRLLTSANEPVLLSWAGKPSPTSPTDNPRTPPTTAASTWMEVAFVRQTMFLADCSTS